MSSWRQWQSGDGSFLRALSAGPGGVLMVREQTLFFAPSLDGKFVRCEVPLVARRVLCSQDGFLIAAGDGKLICKRPDDPRWASNPLKFKVEALVDGDSFSLAVGEQWVLWRAHGQPSWTPHKLPRDHRAKLAACGEQGPVLAATQSGKHWLLKSSDRGKTWHVDGPLPDGLRWLGFCGGRLFFATSETLFVDEDDGPQAVPLPDIEYRLEILAAQGNRLWVQGACRHDSPTLLASSDGGNSFKLISSPGDEFASGVALAGRSLLVMTCRALWVKS